MDELGEAGAALTKFVLGKSGSDAKGLAAEVKLITAIGSALIKTLSKKALNDSLTLAADLTEASDIAGSIAQTIHENLPDGPHKTNLLGNGTTIIGALEKAFAKLAGKAGTDDNLAVGNAIKTVRDGLGASKFENGSVNDPETDTKN
jgi:hypothetical protein